MKQGDGHKLYEQVRAASKPEQRGEARPLSPAEKNQIAAAKSQMQVKYDDAFEKSKTGICDIETRLDSHSTGINSRGERAQELHTSRISLEYRAWCSNTAGMGTKRSPLSCTMLSRTRAGARCCRRSVSASVSASPRSSMSDPKPPWRTRKELYLEHLRRAAASVMLELRQALQARTILADLRDDAGVWNRFSGSRDGTLWYYRSLVDLFMASGSPVARELERVVGEIERLASAAPLA